MRVKDGPNGASSTPYPFRMKENPSRCIRLASLVLVVCAFFVAGAVPALAANMATVYEMHRPGFKIKLTIRGQRIISAEGAFRLRCGPILPGHGKHPRVKFSTSFFETSSENPIRIRKDGSFEEEVSISDEMTSYEEIFRGKVRRNAVAGYFLFDEFTPTRNLNCASGTFANWGVHFIAPRVAG